MPVVVGAAPRLDFPVRDVRGKEVAAVLNFLEDRDAKVLSIVGPIGGDGAQVASVATYRPVDVPVRIVWLEANPQLTADVVAYVLAGERQGRTGIGLAPGLSGPHRYKEFLEQSSVDLILVLANAHRALNSQRQFIDQSLRDLLEAMSEARRAKLIFIGNVEPRIPGSARASRLTLDTWSAAATRLYLAKSMKVSAASVEQLLPTYRNIRLYEEAVFAVSKIRGTQAAPDQSTAENRSPFDIFTEEQQMRIVALQDLPVAVPLSLLRIAIGGTPVDDDLIARGVVVQDADDRYRFSRMVFDWANQRVQTAPREKVLAAQVILDATWRAPLRIDESLALTSWAVPVATRGAESITEIIDISESVKRARETLWPIAAYDKIREYWMLIAEGAQAFTGNQALQWSAMARSNVAQVFMSQGSLDAAQSMFESTHRIAHEHLRWYPDHATSAANLGMIYTLTGNYERALSAWAEYDELLTGDDGTPHLNPYFENSRSVTLLYSGELTKAREVLMRLIETLDDINNNDVRAVAFCNYGELLRREGNIDQAIEYFSRALTVAKEASIARQVPNFLLGRARARLKKGDDDAACVDANAAVEAAANLGEVLTLRRAQLVAGACHCRRGFIEPGRQLIARVQNALLITGFGETASAVAEARGYCDAADREVRGSPLPSETN